MRFTDVVAIDLSVSSWLGGSAIRIQCRVGGSKRNRECVIVPMVAADSSMLLGVESFPDDVLADCC